MENKKESMMHTWISIAGNSTLHPEFIRIEYITAVINIGQRQINSHVSSWKCLFSFRDGDLFLPCNVDVYDTISGHTRYHVMS